MTQSKTVLVHLEQLGCVNDSECLARCKELHPTTTQTICATSRFKNRYQCICFVEKE